jgi:hypothetical protein
MHREGPKLRKALNDFIEVKNIDESATVHTNFSVRTSPLKHAFVIAE